MLSFLLFLFSSSAFAQRKLHPEHGNPHPDCGDNWLLCGYVDDFACCSNLSGLGCCPHKGQENVCKNSPSCNADDSHRDLVDCSSYSDPNTCPVNNICGMWSSEESQPTCQLYNGSCTCICPEVTFDLPSGYEVCNKNKPVDASHEGELCDCPGPIDGFTKLIKIENGPYDPSTQSCPRVFACIRYQIPPPSIDPYSPDDYSGDY